MKEIKLSGKMKETELCFHCEAVIIEHAFLPALCLDCAVAFMKSNGIESAVSR